MDSACWLFFCSLDSLVIATVTLHTYIGYENRHLHGVDYSSLLSGIFSSPSELKMFGAFIVFFEGGATSVQSVYYTTCTQQSALKTIYPKTSPRMYSEARF